MSATLTALCIYVSAVTAIILLTRNFGLFSGWAKSAQCQRCGYIIHGWDTKVWGNDKTCEKCGPDSEWKRVVARPSGFFSYQISDGGENQ